MEISSYCFQDSCVESNVNKFYLYEIFTISHQHYAILAYLMLIKFLIFIETDLTSTLVCLIKEGHWAKHTSIPSSIEVRTATPPETFFDIIYTDSAACTSTTFQETSSVYVRTHALALN